MILFQGNTHGNLTHFFRRSHSGKITILARRVTYCLNHFTSVWDEQNVMIKLFSLIGKSLPVIFTVELEIRSNLHASMMYILNLQKLDMDKCIVNNTYWPFF